MPKNALFFKIIVEIAECWGLGPRPPLASGDRRICVRRLGAFSPDLRVLTLNTSAGFLPF